MKRIIRCVSMAGMIIQGLVIGFLLFIAIVHMFFLKDSAELIFRYQGF